MLDVKVIYLNNTMSKIEPNENSNWVELRASSTVKLRKGETAIIPLGIKLELPQGYEAHIVARKMSFSKYGIIQTSGIEVITADDTKELTIAVMATKDATINFNDRICQMRIEKIESNINYILQ